MEPKTLTEAPVAVLVVDDQPENRLALRAILDGADYRLTEAASGPEALRHLLRKDVEFCLVLLDVFLPGMDGFEVASLLKQRPRSRNVPILFLTASDSDIELIERAYSVGAVDYLCKPVRAELVRSKVAVFADLFRQRKLAERSMEEHRAQERTAQARQLSELRTASDRRYHHLAEAIPQMLWRALPEGRLEYVNGRWVDFIGRSPGGGDADVWAAVDPEHRLRLLPAWNESLREGRPFLCECLLLRSDGAWRWHLRSAIPERDLSGAVVSWLGTDTDIHDLKRADQDRAEALLRERAARAEAEAAQQRAAQLYVEAREAVHLRDEFLTVAAHELRTPLTVLRLQLQMLLRSQVHRPGAIVLDEGQTRMTVRQIERLSFLVDQLLDVSRIGDKHLSLAPARVDLRFVVRDALQRIEEEAARNRCTLSVSLEEPAFAKVDASHLVQALFHLLSNAVKYGRGRPVEVRLEAAGGTASISIRDQGPGIAAQDHARIFERFERAVPVRSFGGLGMGLFLARRIARAHGGAISLRSEVGRGAQFTLEVPLSEAADSLDAPDAGETRVH